MKYNVAFTVQAHICGVFKYMVKVKLQKIGLSLKDGLHESGKWKQKFGFNFEFDPKKQKILQ